MIWKTVSFASRVVLSPLVRRCIGGENIPKGTVIFAANHASYLDHYIVGGHIGSKLGRDIHYLTKKEHFDTLIQRTWHRHLHTIPIDRTAGAAGLSVAIRYLRTGRDIFIYPEGTRTLNGNMGAGKTGVSRLALNARVPVVPVGITNTFDILPKGKTIPRLGIQAELFIGAPIRFDEHYEKDQTNELLRDMTSRIMSEISMLVHRTESTPLRDQHSTWPSSQPAS